MVNRGWLKIFSVLLAIGAWMYVNLVDPPQTRRNVELEVEYINVPQNLWITPLKKRAVVKLEGSRRDFMYARTAKRYAQLKVDFKGLDSGSYKLPVEASHSFPGLSAISITPELLEVEAEKVVTKVIDVLPEVSGRPAEGYLAAEPIITPTQVAVQGAVDTIDKVVAGFIELNLDGIKNSVSQNLDVQLSVLESIEGRKIIAEPSKVSVSVAVKQGYPTKVVKLARPTFRGNLPEGHKLVSFGVVPEEVTVSGPEKLLKTVSELSYRPINMATLSGSTVLPVSLELPNERLELVEPKAVWLDIKLEEAPVIREFLQIPIKTLYDGEMALDLSEKFCAFKIEGYKGEFDDFGAENLKPLVRVPGDLIEESLKVEVELGASLPAGLKILSAEPKVITVTTRELED